jgi:protein transport protein SEC23
MKEGRQGYLQFCTKYRHSSGRTHLRVTTLARQFADPKTEKGVQYIKAGFDQEAAAVIMARAAVFKVLAARPVPSALRCVLCADLCCAVVVW